MSNQIALQLHDGGQAGNRHAGEEPRFLIASSEVNSAGRREGSDRGEYAGDEARWRAVLGREPAADGAFYYAVRSTRIYCRPTCPARRPRREHVAFFDTPQEAERAGFRSCRRCRPDEVSDQQQVIARVQHLLDTAETAPSLSELGAAVGMSPAHLQRTFK